jgi:hypothetical protein
MQQGPGLLVVGQVKTYLLLLVFYCNSKMVQEHL